MKIVGSIVVVVAVLAIGGQCAPLIEGLFNKLPIRVVRSPEPGCHECEVSSVRYMQFGPPPRGPPLPPPPPRGPPPPPRGPPPATVIIVPARLSKTLHKQHVGDDCKDNGNHAVQNTGQSNHYTQISGSGQSKDNNLGNFHGGNSGNVASSSSFASGTSTSFGVQNSGSSAQGSGFEQQGNSFGSLQNGSGYNQHGSAIQSSSIAESSASASAQGGTAFASANAVASG